MIIRNLHISKFWGKYTLNWKLNEGVNVLSGINGSGKSTVLRAMAELLKADFVDPFVGKRMQKIEIEFSDDYSIHLESYRDNLTALRSKAQSNNALQKIIEEVESKNEIANRPDFKTIVEAQSFQILEGTTEIDKEKYLGLIQSDFISTFDFAPKRPKDPKRAIEYVLNSDFSELDRHLEDVIERYMTYQFGLSTKMANVMAAGGDDYESVKKIFADKNRFLDIYDDMMRPSGKRINRDSGEIEFFFKDDEITHSYRDLSAGEKQLLLIMLTVFMQGGQQAILIMDEPEISLHIDWQSQLLARIKEINPNCQIVISTHSPSVIIDGWQDCVVNIDDLISLQ